MGSHNKDDPDFDGNFFGYDTSKNTELLENRHMAYKMGDGDVSHYNIEGASGNNFSKYHPTMDRSKMPGGKDASGINTDNRGSNWADARGNYDDAHKAWQFANSSDSNVQNIMKNNTIEHIRHRILGQNAKGASEVAGHWRAVKGTLDDMSKSVHDPTYALWSSDKWTGDAAKAFFQMGPGATLKSLQDWTQAAQNNIDAFDHLASIIPGYHQQIIDLYNEYKGAIKTASDTYFDSGHPGWNVYDQHTHLHIKSADELMSKGSPSDQNQFIAVMKGVGAIYHLKAQDIELNMANDYQTAITKLQQGLSTTFEGPWNAVMDRPGTVPPPNLGAGPGAGPGATPNVAKPNVAKPNIAKPNIAKPNVPPPDQPVQDAVAPEPPPVAPPAVSPPPAQTSAPPPPGPTPAPAPVPAPVPPVAPTAPPALGRRLAPSTSPTTQNAFRSNAQRPPGLNRSGVLGDRGANRPSAPNSEAPSGRPNASRPPASPAKPARNGKAPSRPGEPEGGRGGGRPGSRSPANPQGAKGKPGQQQQRRPGAPGELDENSAFRRPPGGTSPSVLDNKRVRPPDPASEDAQRLSGRPGSGPPNTTKPVLNNRGQKQKKPDRQQSRPTGPVSGLPMDNAFVPPPSGTAPVLENPTQWMRPGAPADTSEVPTSLRTPTRMPSGANLSSARPGTDSAAELAARKAAQRERERQKKTDEEYEKIRAWMDGEEAFTVETPGGPVVSSQAPTPEQLAHPKPKLGA
ncbi:hypothetical protein Athai_07680 [Actinocatenispora thailandica]|uniref:Uncharacterized protein n=2 Tax=Actinocatenispora thailandica TaxID=227318 RepID=A0A7R7DK88_9ACTN|nr:hypothetical protein Athai_07680 [Actinocatenispora thailandica]